MLKGAHCAGRIRSILSFVIVAHFTVERKQMFLTVDQPEVDISQARVVLLLL